MTIEELYKEAKEQGMLNAEIYYKHWHGKDFFGEEIRPFLSTLRFDKNKNQVRI